MIPSNNIDIILYEPKIKNASIFPLQFAAEVYKRVKENGHEIVGVFTVPDSNNREDPVATVAK